MWRRLRPGIRLLAQCVKHRRSLARVVSAHVFFLENRNLSLWGSISEEEGQAVAALVDQIRDVPGPIVEVGTLFGLTTQLLASRKEPGRKLITIDNFSWNPFNMPPRDHQAFTRRALRYLVEHRNVEIFEGTSQEFFDSYQGEPPALVFLDGDHSYAVVRDELARARALGTALISGHDYSEIMPGVQLAVGEAFGSAFSLRESIWSAWNPDSPYAGSQSGLE